MFRPLALVAHHHGADLALPAVSSARNAAFNAALKEADGLMTVVHAQTQLHEANYDPAVRSALVGPAHTAVMRSARALAHAAVQHTPKDAP